MKGKDRIRQMTLPVLRVHFVIYDNHDPLAERIGVERTISLRGLSDKTIEDAAVLETMSAIRSMQEVDDGT